MEAQTPAGLDRLRLGDRVLCDVFPDQVNIVQVDRGGDRHTILFTAGDGYKLIP